MLKCIKKENTNALKYLDELSSQDVDYQKLLDSYDKSTKNLNSNIEIYKKSQLIMKDIISRLDENDIIQAFCDLLTKSDNPNKYTSYIVSALLKNKYTYGVKSATSDRYAKIEFSVE